MYYVGILTKYIETRGFGFIKRLHSDRDAFMHISNVKFDDIALRDVVVYEEEFQFKGLAALNVIPVFKHFNEFCLTNGEIEDALDLICNNFYHAVFQKIMTLDTEGLKPSVRCILADALFKHSPETRTLTRAAELLDDKEVFRVKFTAFLEEASKQAEFANSFTKYLPLIEKYGVNLSNSILNNILKSYSPNYIRDVEGFAKIIANTGFSKKLIDAAVRKIITKNIREILLHFNETLRLLHCEKVDLFAMIALNRDLNEIEDILKDLVDKSLADEFCGYYIENYVYGHNLTYTQMQKAFNLCITHNVRVDEIYFDDFLYYGTPKPLNYRPSTDDEVYHLTHINNFSSILINGLLARNELIRRRNRVEDIANQDIISKRQLVNEDNEIVDLNECIPFHFMTKTAFDYVIKRDYGADNFAYIAIKRFLRNNRGYEFGIVPSHPRNNNAVIYEYATGYPLINWNIIDSTDPYANYEYENKQQRMAECIVNAPHGIPVEDFAAIYVLNADVKTRLLDIADSVGKRSLLRRLIVVEPRLF